MTSTPHIPASVERLARRIGPAAHDPVRRHRRYPYRVAPDDGPEVAAAIRADLGQIVTGIENMLFQLTRRRLPHLCDHAREDVVQDLRLRLVEHSLPRYDSAAGSRVTTFAYACITRHLQAVARADALRTRRESVVQAINEMPVHDRRDHTLDRRVEEVAEHVITHPEQYFTRGQTRVLRAMVDAGPDALLRDVAADLGIGPSSLSTAVHRMAKRLGKIDLWEWSAEQVEGRPVGGRPRRAKKSENPA